MGDILVNIEGVGIYTLSAFVFLAFLWSSFVFYKKAIEYNETEETVFDTVLVIGFLSFVFARLGFVMTKLDWFVGHWIRVLFVKEYPGMSGWGVLFGVLLGTLIMVRRFKRKHFDWLDLISLGLSAGIPIVYAANGVLSMDQSVGGIMAPGTAKGILLGSWFFFLWWVEGEYRTFDWYRFKKTQARTGFVLGMFLLGLGGVNFGVDLLTNEVRGRYVYLLLVVVGALVVYIRSERKLKKDLSLMGVSLKKLLIEKKLFVWLKIKRK